MQRCSQSGSTFLEIALVLSMTMAGLIAIVDVFQIFNSYRALREVSELAVRNLVTTQGAGVKVEGSSTPSAHQWYIKAEGSNRAVAAGLTRPAACNQNGAICEIRYPRNAASARPIVIKEDFDKVVKEFATKEMKVRYENVRFGCEESEMPNCFSISVDHPAQNQVMVTSTFSLPLMITKILGRDSLTISASARDYLETSFQNREVLSNNQPRSYAETIRDHEEGDTDADRDEADLALEPVDPDALDREN